MNKTTKDSASPSLMDKIISLSKRRGFIFPGSAIYGGLANSWDFGPLGAELKWNIKRRWWDRFVRRRADIVGLDASLIMNPRVWEVSGHLKNFSDPLIECKKCHERFRADAPEFARPENSKETVACPSCGSKEGFTEPRQFNLMFKTFFGPVEDAAHTVYLRPETAQAMFINFKHIIDTMRPKIPFGIAQIGKAFRNEITPGNFIFRTREFEQMEIEYFIRPEEWEAQFDRWCEEMKLWLDDLGISRTKLHFREVPKNERAHYSEKTIDIDYEFPFGTDELYGLAYRGDYDLKVHMKASGEDLSYANPDDQKDKFTPHVIEPTWGVERSVLAAMCEAYHEEEAPTSEEGEVETRVVMKFPKWFAPVKAAILPLSKKEELVKVARPLYEDLRKRFLCEYDETQSIGKRYRRQDEIGTPYCITVDFETLNDYGVTVRDRDTMKQDRVKIAEVAAYLKEKLCDV